MSRSQRLRVFAYDISDDKKRRRVAQILEECCTRVQYSVFEGIFTDVAVSKLVSEIEGVLSPSDSLRVYTLGKPGERKSFVVGQGIPLEKDRQFWLY